MALQGDLSVERMCQLTQVSRAGFYRYLRGGWQAEEEEALLSVVHVIVIQHRWSYGSGESRPSCDRKDLVT
jgi:hypothetical protein